MVLLKNMTSFNGKSPDIKKYLGAGAFLAISVAPLICDGKKCIPLSVPDLPSYGGFSYDYSLNQTISASSVISSTATGSWQP